MSEPMVEVLREGAMSDDLLHIAPAGYAFKYGYVAVVEYYTYANEWSERKNMKGFRSLEAAYKFIDKMGLRKEE